MYCCIVMYYSVIIVPHILCTHPGSSKGAKKTDCRSTLQVWPFSYQPNQTLPTTTYLPTYLPTTTYHCSLVTHTTPPPQLTLFKSNNLYSILLDIQTEITNHLVL